MSIHKELQKRINKEKSGLQEDLRKVDEVRTALAVAQSAVEKRQSYILGLEEAFKLIPKSEAALKPVVRNLRPGSLMARARNIILNAGCPLYIDTIVEELDMTDPKTRTSLAGSLRSYAKKNEIFTITAPNTFGLIELGNDGGQVTIGIEEEEEEFFDPFAAQ